jgi:predicted  nucleic acid-binding Zn-ribbon protein
MKYRCTGCGHVGEQSTFLKPNIQDNMFSYSNACPVCGATNAFTLIDDEIPHAGDEVERRVDEIMARARDNAGARGVNEKMLITEEELSNLKKSSE